MVQAELKDQIAICMSQRKNLETIFNSVTDGILAVDADLRVVNLNMAAAEITGWEPDQALGEPCSALFPPGDDSEECDLSGALETGRMLEDLETEIRRPDGEIRLLHLTTHLLRDDAWGLQGLVAIFRDVTELRALQSALEERSGFERLVGKSHRMQEIYELIEDIGESEATVLILGESGTGKELVAEAIHRQSFRRSGPFVKVNCSALSEGVLESELFGHVKGAFTGAYRDKPGRFELANGGTIFLDEIGDISRDVQVKLLRVLQEREFERVGGSKTQKTDVRVIAATHGDLRKGMAEGRFRQDLYYRLYVVPIELPPLRERKEDVPLLAQHFVAKFRQQTGKQIGSCSPESMSLFMDHEWPGNVRELENAIEHAFVKCRGGEIGMGDLPVGLVREARDGSDGLGDLEATERERLLRALERAGWNRSRAARMLGLHRTTVWRKMREHGIVEPDI